MIKVSIHDLMVISTLAMLKDVISVILQARALGLTTKVATVFTLYLVVAGCAPKPDPKVAQLEQRVATLEAEVGQLRQMVTNVVDQAASRQHESTSLLRYDIGSGGGWQGWSGSTNAARR